MADTPFPSQTSAQEHSLTPADIGVGMRLSVHPHCDDFADVILGALRDVAELPATQRLTVETETVSTYVGATVDPAAQDLADYAVGLISAASHRSGRRHVVSHLLLSRGCPGEATCALTAGPEGNLPAEPRVKLAPTGIEAVVGWSLYPLDDSGAAHIDAIMEAIDEARRVSGGELTVTSRHYATELRGDLSAVLSVVFDAWTGVGRAVPHVVTHVTVSVDSPSESGPEARA